MHLKSKLVTVQEAIELLGVEPHRFLTWQRSGYFTCVRYVKHAGKGRRGLYLLSQVSEVIEKLRDTPRPEGYITSHEAMARLGVSAGSIQKLVRLKTVRSQVGRVNGVVVTWILASDITLQDSSRKRTVNVTSTLHSTQTENAMVEDAIAAEPVLYGLLTRLDVEVLEKRRAMLQARRSTAA